MEGGEGGFFYEVFSFLFFFATFALGEKGEVKEEKPIILSYHTVRHPYYFFFPKIKKSNNTKQA